MAKEITLTRDAAELIVDVLEDNFFHKQIGMYGMGIDVAAQIRKAFGMCEQLVEEKNG